MKKFKYEAVTGHELICTKLQQAVMTGRTVSAYLFSGAEGIGKKTVARPFAAALLCHAPENGHPCLRCSSCKLLAAHAHPDYITLDTPADKKSIGVEIVREQLIKEAYVRPFSSARKVFIIEEGERLTAEAQNALLKLLEEPPEYAVFLILTVAQDQLLETVRSRCLKLQLLPLSYDRCHTYFEALPNDDHERKKLAASFAQGVIGRGQKMLLDDAFYGLYHDTLATLQQFIDTLSGFTEMQRFLTENKDKIEDIIDFMLVFLRDALHLCLVENTKLICSDQQAAVIAVCKKLPPRKLVGMMEAVIHFRKRLQRNANFTVAGLELLTRMQEEIHDQSNRNSIQIGG